MTARKSIPHRPAAISKTLFEEAGAWFGMLDGRALIGVERPLVQVLREVASRFRVRAVIDGLHGRLVEVTGFPAPLLRRHAEVALNRLRAASEPSVAIQEFRRRNDHEIKTGGLEAIQNQHPVVGW